MLDIAARGLWSPMEMECFDIRVLHRCGAKSNANHNTSAKMYSKQRERKTENMETAEYRLKNEKGTCNGIVFSTTGGMGPQATMFLKRVAILLAAKTSQDKSLANLRYCLGFGLLKTVLIAVRGHRGRYYEKAIPDEPKSRTHYQR